MREINVQDSRVNSGSYTLNKSDGRLYKVYFSDESAVVFNEKARRFQYVDMKTGKLGKFAKNSDARALLGSVESIGRYNSRISSRSLEAISESPIASAALIAQTTTAQSPTTRSIPYVKTGYFERMTRRAARMTVEAGAALVLAAAVMAGGVMLAYSIGADNREKALNFSTINPQQTQIRRYKAEVNNLRAEKKELKEQLKVYDFAPAETGAVRVVSYKSSGEVKGDSRDGIQSIKDATLWAQKAEQLTLELLESSVLEKASVKQEYEREIPLLTDYHALMERGTNVVLGVAKIVNESSIKEREKRAQSEVLIRNLQEQSAVYLIGQIDEPIARNEPIARSQNIQPIEVDSVYSSNATVSKAAVSNITASKVPMEQRLTPTVVSVQEDSSHSARAENSSNSLQTQYLQASNQKISSQQVSSQQVSSQQVSSQQVSSQQVSLSAPRKISLHIPANTEEDYARINAKIARISPGRGILGSGSNIVHFSPTKSRKDANELIGFNPRAKRTQQFAGR